MLFGFANEGPRHKTFGFKNVELTPKEITANSIDFPKNPFG